MKICGIELKSSEARIAVIETIGDEISFITMNSKKISLADDECNESIRSFYDTFCSFIRNNGIEVVALKKRAKKGDRAGGAVSFKLEGLIQLCPDARIELHSPQAISAMNKKSTFEIPKGLNKYQEQAFLTACCCAAKMGQGFH
jgi:hypothetical protein